MSHELLLTILGGINLESKRAHAVAKFRQHAPVVLPSLLQCDFGDLRHELTDLRTAGASILHLDVMDGHFVPNLSYGMPIVKGLRLHTDMPMDVHLMISNPAAYARAMVDSGADSLTFHAEAVDDMDANLAALEELDCGIGIAINPGTAVSTIASVIPRVDMVLIMSVEAGFGGQAFHDSAIDKIREVRSLSADVLIEVDGGIDETTIGQCAAAGADLFVVGSAIFGKPDYGKAIAGLEAAIAAADVQ